MTNIISNQNYQLLIGYQANDKYRIAFNALVNEVFGFSFEAWYQAGYWNNNYIPYTLFDGEEAVANVSVNLMQFNILNKFQNYTQIGTVLTKEAYRKQGLSRFLMEKVIADWQTKSDLIYLFANKNSAEMYPKFGFCAVGECQYFKPVLKKPSDNTWEKLDIELPEDQTLLYNYILSSKPVSQLCTHKNIGLIMFYALSIYKNHIYYLRSLETIAIATFEDNELHLVDVFSKINIELDVIINALSNEYIDKVLLGFVPLDSAAYQSRQIYTDDTLFIQKHQTELFDRKNLMFPILSHA